MADMILFSARFHVQLTAVVHLQRIEDATLKFTH